MPKSKAEMMKSLREKREKLGLREVRGIWARPELHDVIKECENDLKSNAGEVFTTSRC